MQGLVLGPDLAHSAEVMAVPHLCSESQKRRQQMGVAASKVTTMVVELSKVTTMGAELSRAATMVGQALAKAVVQMVAPDSMQATPPRGVPQEGGLAIQALSVEHNCPHRQPAQEPPSSIIINVF